MLQTVAAYGAPVLELVELAAWRVPSAVDGPAPSAR